jgi:hypothetical protein
LDVCHVDEAGFAPTLPTSYSWSVQGQARRVPYEAPQGRRVNVLGAYFSHGPQQGTLEFYSLARLPERKGKNAGSLAEQAAEHGLTPEEVGVLDSEVFLAFLWMVAGRPPEGAEDWQRERPLHIVLDNYSVHRSERVRLEERALSRAGVHLFYLPPYSPELSRIESHWCDVKGRGLPQRNYTLAGELKQAVDLALLRKAIDLRQAHQKTEALLPGTP